MKLNARYIHKSILMALHSRAIAIAKDIDIAIARRAIRTIAWERVRVV